MNVDFHFHVCAGGIFSQFHPFNAFSDLQLSILYGTSDSGSSDDFPW